MEKELFCVVASVVGLVSLIGLGLYLGDNFIGEFLKYLAPIFVVVILGKLCTNYLNKKSFQKKN